MRINPKTTEIRGERYVATARRASGTGRYILTLYELPSAMEEMAAVRPVFVAKWRGSTPDDALRRAEMSCNFFRDPEPKMLLRTAALLAWIPQGRRRGRT